MNAIHLITGASGNLGVNVVAELRARGRRVRALVFPGDRTSEHLPSDVEQCAGDVLDLDSLRRFFSVPDGAEVTVIHMAAIVTTNPEPNRRVHDVNVTGTKNVVDLCTENKVKKLVYVSSSSAIPELPKGQTIREVDFFDPAKVVGYYAKTKAEATQLVLDAARTKGLDASVVFPTGICGPGDYAGGHLTQLVVDASTGRLPAGIMGGFDCADVRDLARGVVLCAERGAPGEGYILGNRCIPVREFLREVHEQSGAKAIKVMLPAWLAKLSIPFLRLHYFVKKRKPLFTSFSLYNLTRNNEYSSEKARRLLGYRPRPLRETIGDTLLWLRKEGRLPQMATAAGALSRQRRFGRRER